MREDLKNEGYVNNLDSSWGCTAVQEDDRVCIDWDSTVEVVERCVPLYGNMVCTTEEKARYWCKLYEEMV